VRVVAGILGIAYGVMHGVGAPPATARIPPPARAAWLVLAAITVLAAAGLVFIDGGALVALLAVGVLGIAGLAIANGYWIHGRPTWSHHAVRLVFALAVLVPATLA
jgi:hypothetical protein